MKSRLLGIMIGALILLVGCAGKDEISTSTSEVVINEAENKNAGTAESEKDTDVKSDGKDDLSERIELMIAGCKYSVPTTWDINPYDDELCLFGVNTRESVDIFFKAVNIAEKEKGLETITEQLNNGECVFTEIKPYEDPKNEIFVMLGTQDDPNLPKFIRHYVINTDNVGVIVITERSEEEEPVWQNELDQMVGSVDVSGVHNYLSMKNEGNASSNGEKKQKGESESISEQNGAMPKDTETSEIETAQEKTSGNDKQVEPESNHEQKKELSGKRNEQLTGRGASDEGREEPQYVGVIGYVVVGTEQEYELKNTDDFESEEYWKIPTFEQDKQFWEETDTYLSHKTEVVVKKQFLEDEGWGFYSGKLLVETIDEDQFYIDVNNFITKPYWEYGPKRIMDAAKIGPFVAEFNQNSEYYPVNTNGDKVELSDGTRVLVTGTSVVKSVSKVEAIVWNEWSRGYGGVSVYFTPDDLSIMY